MNVPKLPAVHLPPPVIGDRQYVVQDAVILDLPPSNKFSFSWPSDTGRPTSTTPPSERPAHSSSEAETDTSEAEPVAGHREADQFEDSNATPTTHLNSQLPAQPNHPWHPRTFSVPLPSQLGHLQNPHRPEPASSSKQHNLDQVSLGFSQFHELSLELADSVQMVIQTMLQISPPQVLDAAKEQFSACSLSVPTSSMSAMFTAMKNLNYISANMTSFCVEPSNIRQDEMDFVEPLGISSNVHNDFDIGEMLQSVGDALSGTAAQAGVDLVLFHGDVGMKHASVKGDENGISYTLSHVRVEIIFV
jgi:osomolarity two-component system response regulator SSK1